MKERFEFIFSSYKKAAAVLVILAVMLSIPITLVQLSRQQESRSRAAGTISISLSPVPQVNVGETFQTHATMNTEGNYISTIDITLTYNSDTIELVGLYHSPPGFVTISNTVIPGTARYTGFSTTPLTGTQIDIGYAEFRVKLVGGFQIQMSALVNTAPPTGTPVPPTNTPTPTPILCTQSNNTWTCPAGYVCNFPIEGGSPPYCTPASPTATPTNTPTPTPPPVSVTGICTVMCIAPPEACHYEGGSGCSCGTLVCPTCTLKFHGDANCDMQVNTDDFNVWRDEFLKVISNRRSDFNNNGTVDTDDFNVWRDGFLNPQVAH